MSESYPESGTGICIFKAKIILEQILLRTIVFIYVDTNSHYFRIMFMVVAVVVIVNSEKRNFISYI